MNIIKRAAKTVPIVAVLFWLALLIYTIIKKYLYETTFGAEPLALVVAGWLYNLLILASTMGIISSVLLLLCICTYLKNSCSRKPNVLEIVTLVLGVAINLVFYVSVFLVFRVPRDMVVVFPALWLACTIVCIGLLIFLKIRRSNAHIPVQVRE